MNLPFDVHAVNIFGVSPPKSSQPYHHGDLRNALIEAAVAQVREGGPEGAGAIVLRDAARRVGVTANAAYRHFDGLPDLVDAVRQYGFRELSQAMRSELAALKPSGSPAVDAMARLNAVGRGYVHFALAEPGLFALAFTPPKASEPTGPAASRTEPPDFPWSLLQSALDGLVDTGVLATVDRPAAATSAWSTVHGLSLLLLGPMADLSADAKEQVITDTLDLCVRGLAIRSPG